ncbi:hypothetical protein Y032_0189g1170 [Ancylostoma ceylanicum]|uniref:Uncharacterized protein n=1 Tax=Ancylostoma ceylanicum TaxID=53326 RepID=A0A016SQB5_9BILA|nr:hypothetical protein Y032_0189g1170 [Ancylostoma ceylanicum]
MNLYVKEHRRQSERRKDWGAWVGVARYGRGHDVLANHSVLTNSCPNKEDNSSMLKKYIKLVPNSRKSRIDERDRKWSAAFSKSGI